MKICGLLGRKLGHSYSPMVHNAFDMGYSYSLFEVEPGDLPEFLKNGNFHGLNVTIPYKKDVIPFCTELSPTAQAIGSVNTILRLPGGGLFGYNTDCQGFLAMLKQSGINPAGKKIIVLGSGGSSLTVCYALKQQKAAEIIVVSRGGKNNYDNLQYDAQIIVNTTPIGMYPEKGKTLINPEDFPKLEGVLDLVYNPAKTKLILDAEEKNIPSLGGITMLVGQAAAAAGLFAGNKKVDIKLEKSVTVLLRRKMENIVLIGMPGCGKSTIARLLAEKTGKEFIDADQKLEEKTGKTIPEIFKTEGEPAFRRYETEILEEYGKKSSQVIATGGGCVTVPENFYHIKQNSTVIFLERDLSKLEREGRPLSENSDLQAMYDSRLPLYQKFADYTVKNTTFEEVVDGILIGFL